jgi:hypothetical protein
MKYGNIKELEVIKRSQTKFWAEKYNNHMEKFNSGV